MDSTNPPVIQIKNASLITKEGHSIWKSIGMEIKAGTIHGVIGESGSGKSTLALALFSILPDDSKFTYDQFSMLGCDVFSKDFTEKKNVFLVPQNPNLAFHPYRTIGSQVLDFLKLSNLTLVSEEMVLSYFDQLSIPRGHWNRVAKNLSGGEKQRILLTLAFLRLPKILVLDEPTTGLDAFSEKIVLETVQNFAKSGMTVVFITHELRIIESLASQVTIMKEGEVIETLPINNHQLEPNSEYGKQLKEASVLFQ
ncbi:ATP-binding cassette domain-containing protein [Leptospira levettii]|uniref:ATP-binding cassette domain-containing protein n=2 Tax=Leptospira levettii TaxID=2023178 RepID=A0AAW5VBD1_9LEPT|nr:ATP-binding cassette domain-containing protein [Leptospira levettii]MCW7466616.1 ATP-binding cassette domain-containing protein [Leptospira levettii]MCW7511818.1 ATP-binding cassette domain-containing protein [Leptospira levettii]MCW7515578.1 ATP-binding cassette domain-containing protein [Leptospira levettii]